MALTGSLNGAWDDGVIQTMTEMRNDVQGITYTGLDRTNLSTDSSLVTISTSAPSSPKTGEIWVDTSTLTGAPAVRPRIYNGTEWIGAPIYHSLTAPTSVTTGLLWYDMTLEMLRVYKSGTEDLHGVAGWHPVSDAYQLWTNRSGGTISANRVVIQDTADGTERGVTTSANHKDASVVGVTMESIADDATGVVAVVGGGAFVDVYCNVTSGNVALGDYIGNSGVAGEGRTLGSVAGNPKATSSTYVEGVPYGAFAQAQAVISSAGTVACRLLGAVGRGATIRKAATIIAALANGLANDNWDGGWDEVDVASYPPGSGGSDFIADAKHKPILGVLLAIEGAVDHSTGGQLIAVNLDLGPDGVTALANLAANLSTVGTENSPFNTSEAFVPTSAGSGTPTVLGNKFYWSGTRTAGAGTTEITSASFKAVGYRF